MSSKIVVIRPYHNAIRVKVFEALESLGYEIPEDYIFEKGMPDELISEGVTSLKPDAILIPYNAHEDTFGNKVNGIETLDFLSRTHPHLENIPAFMPLATFKSDSMSHLFSPYPGLNLDRIITIERQTIDSGQEQLVNYIKNGLAEMKEVTSL